MSGALNLVREARSWQAEIKNSLMQARMNVAIMYGSSTKHGREIAGLSRRRPRVHRSFRIADTTWRSCSNAQGLICHATRVNRARSSDVGRDGRHLSSALKFLPTRPVRADSAGELSADL